jgi:uncharacterized protein (TIGR03067 family)
MSRLCLVVGALACAAAPAPPCPEEQAKKDLEKMQGTWLQESVTADGKDEPAEALDKVKLVFDVNKLVMKSSDSDHKHDATIKLDASKTPAAIDVKLPTGDVLLGIYEIKGDTLKLAVTMAQGKRPKEECDRPTKFESLDKSGVVLLVLKRDTSGAPDIDVAAALAALEMADQIELLSLEPSKGDDNDKAKDAFHGWMVLGKTTVKKDDAKTLSAAAMKALSKDDRLTEKGFAPSQGLRVTAHGRAYDFVIGYRTVRVEVYIDDKRLGERRVCESLEQKLAKLLKDAGVPLAPKPGADK